MISSTDVEKLVVSLYAKRAGQMMTRPGIRKIRSGIVQYVSVASENC